MEPWCRRRIGPYKHLSSHTLYWVQSFRCMLLMDTQQTDKTRWKHLIHLIWFFLQTLDIGIVYKPRDAKDVMEQLGIVVSYVDADYAGCIDTRHSTTGYVSCSAMAHFPEVTQKQFMMLSLHGLPYRSYLLR